MKDVINNTIILESCLKDFQDKSGFEQEYYAFDIFSITHIFQDKELSIDQIEDSIIDGANDGGVDSIICFINDQYIYSTEQLDELALKENNKIEVNIIQCKYEKSFKEDFLDKLFINLHRLLNLETTPQDLLLIFNPKLVDKILLVREMVKKLMGKGLIIDFNFYYSCKSNTIKFNSVFKVKKDQIIKWVNDNFRGSRVNFNLVSAEELIDIIQRPKKTDRTLNFKENPIPILYSNFGTGFLGIVSLKDYFNFITEDNKIIEPIFDSNVRDFQGDIEVNKQIRETIKNDFHKDFWWLNNGITIIASKFIQILKKLDLKNVQIVNGLQTSFEIANNLEVSREDERSILIKVIITEDKETIDKIISASNSQTYVTPAVLRATDELHRRIEVYFSSRGYFYERRKNYYRNQGAPTKKIFSIQNTAQTFEAICNFNISVARSTPTKLIRDNRSYENIFNNSIDFNVYLNCCLLYRKVYDFILTLDNDIKSRVKNFSYHLVRVLASFITNKSKYSVLEIKEINIEIIEVGLITKSYDFLQGFISEYQIENPEEIITNIAKSKKFVDSLNEKLEDTFI